jgi:steroid delta-isomerase-like uncharacterized protein
MLSKRILLMVALGAVLFAPAGVRGEDNKALMRRWFEEVLNKGNMAAVGDFIAPTYVGHAPGAPDVKGPDGFRQRHTALSTAFPDLRFTIEDLIDEGDKVTVRYTAHGTHKGGDYLGVAPTGQEMTWAGLTVFHLANGKFQEAWLMSDLGRQLSMVAAQRQSKQ